MTCEVAVANKLGIALAADSAVTRTKNGDRTYASGVNKIFQLTEKFPVACLIYNNASIASVPWELLIKDFRGSCTIELDKIEDYHNAFLDYIQSPSSEGLLSQEVRDFGNLVSIFQAVNNVLERLSRTIDGEVVKGIDIQNSISNSYDLATQYLNKVPYSAAVADIDPVSYIIDNKNFAKDYILSNQNWSKYKDIDKIISIEDISEFVLQSLLKEPTEILRGNYTGIVIAGYGKKEYLPCCSDMKIYGFISNQLLYSTEKTNRIKAIGSTSFILPFATSNMVETFMFGASKDVNSFVKASFNTHAKNAIDSALTQIGMNVDEQLVRKAVADSVSPFMNKWTANAINAHLDPLLDIVSGLPLIELGGLAETFVMLESLKEKVTRGTQSVGGPIDVAMITKYEGLVWLKRKQYFDPSLNPRYVDRMHEAARSLQ